MIYKIILSNRVKKFELYILECDRAHYVDGNNTKIRKLAKHDESCTQKRRYNGEFFV